MRDGASWGYYGDILVYASVYTAGSLPCVVLLSFITFAYHLRQEMRQEKAPQMHANTAVSSKDPQGCECLASASSKSSATNSVADEKIRQEMALLMQEKRQEMRQEKALQMHASAAGSPTVASASSKGSATSSEADEVTRQGMEDSARMAEMPSIYDAEEHFSVAERRPTKAKAGASAAGASAAALSAARALRSSSSVRLKGCQHACPTQAYPTRRGKVLLPRPKQQLK